MKRVSFTEDSVLGEGNGCQHVGVRLGKVLPVLSWTTDCRCPDILVVRNLVDVFVRCVNSFDSKKTFAECIEYLNEYATRKESYTTQLSRRKANLLSSTPDPVLDNPSSEDLAEKNEMYNMDLYTLTSVCKQADIEVTLENLRFVNNAMKETSKKSPYFIPRDAWKLIVKTFGDDTKKYIKAQKLEEGNKIPTPNHIPPSRPNASMPPILLKKQYDMSQNNRTFRVKWHSKY